MNEVHILSTIRRKLKETLGQRALIFKLADRFTRGLPDLLVIGVAKEGPSASLVVEIETPVVLALEVKTKLGKQSPLQKAMQTKFDGLGIQGIHYAVVRSWEDAEKACREVGLIS